MPRLHRVRSADLSAWNAPSSTVAPDLPARASARARATVLLAIALLALLTLTGLSARSATSQTPPAQPFALQYAATLGSTDTPWLRSNAYLNQPWGLGADRDGIWVANALGRNLVRFGTGPLEELGRAGSLLSLWGQPVRRLADVAVVSDLRQRGQPPRRTPTPDPNGASAAPPYRYLWFADEGAHVVVNLRLWPDGGSDRPQVIGEPGVAGADDAHLHGPTGVAADSWGGVYVSDTGNHRVLAFDSKLKLLATIGQTGVPGSGPYSLDRPARLAWRDDLLYVADSGNHRVQAFDVKDPAAPRLVQTYGQSGVRGSGAGQLDTPLGLAVDASFLYVADSGNARVEILERGDGDHFATLDGEQIEGCGNGRPEGRWSFVSDVALDDTGTIFVAQPRDMGIQSCDAFTRRLRAGRGFKDQPYIAQADLLNAPAGLAIAADGTVLVAEIEGQRVVGLRGGGLPNWTSGAAGVAGADDNNFDQPVDVVGLADGRVVVADRGNGRLVVLDAEGKRLDAWGSGSLDAPDGLAALPDGGVAVADAAAGRVRRFDAAGAPAPDPPGAAGGPFAAPADVALGLAGQWFVSDRAAHAVYAFDASGRSLFTLGEPGLPGDDFAHLRSPDGLAVDAAGRLYVADSGNHRVQVFAADGFYLTTVGGVRGPGTGGFFEPGGVVVGPDGRVYVADTYQHRVQVFAPAGGSWLPASVNGFGRRASSAIMSLAEFDGGLYAGTRDEGGGGLWRRAADGSWAAMAQPGFGAPGHHAVQALAVFGDRLYAGTEHLLTRVDPISRQRFYDSEGAQLWRSADGQAWETVAQGGFGQKNNSGVGSLAVFKGRLYAGTRIIDQRTPAELWRSASGAAGDWQRVRIDLFSRSDWTRIFSISAMTEYSGTLLAGTCSGPRAQVWRSDNGDQWRAVGQLAPDADPRDADPRLGSGGAVCVTSFAEFKGWLYAGLGNEPYEVGGRYWGYGGAELWRCRRCDGTDWEPATAPGLGSAANSGQLALMPIDESPFQFLYLAVGNLSEGLQIWRALDGLDWEPVAEGGFGDDDNQDVAGAAMAVQGGRLFVGSHNMAHGAELWSSEGSRPGVAPTVPGPAATATPRPAPQPPTGRARYQKVAEWPVGAAAPPDVLGQAVDMALGDDATVYLLDRQPGRVVVLRPDGRWGKPFGDIGSGPDRVTLPGAIGVDSAHDRVYVSDLGTERLVTFDRQGKYLQSIPDVYAVDVSVRPDGMIWVADHLAGAARLLSPEGKELERLGSYGPGEDDQSLALVSAVEDPGGRLWVADKGGRRLRAFERGAGGVFDRVRTVDLGGNTYSGCDGARLQALADDVILAGACILEGGRVLRRLPGRFPGNDLCGVRLRSAEPSAGLYFALALHDPDPACEARDREQVWPEVVRFLDDGFDIVSGTWRARRLSTFTASDNAVADPSRLTAMADGTVVLSDAFGLRRFSPEGRVLETLPTASYPSRGASLVIDPNLVVATGGRGQVAGVAQYTYGRAGDIQMVVYGRGVERRYCQARRCAYGTYLETLWDTSLSTVLTELNYAATFVPTRQQYVLLQLWRDNPAGIAFPARLLLYPLADQGRKTEVLLDGTDREALWTDVDAGPGGDIYVLDTLNDRVQVVDPMGNRLRQLPTPKDAWKVAGGPNGEVFLLTTYGHVVRLAADGTVLSRFIGLPNDLAPATAQADLAVDAWGRVYVIDTLYDQVTVFEPQGTEDAVLEGGHCSLAGDKWVTPQDILLGETAELSLALSGTCGYVEEPADIVLAVSARPASELRNLLVARQIAGVVDLDRHRLGVLSFVINSNIEAGLTHDRDKVIRALSAVAAGRPVPGCELNTLAALKASLDVFEDVPGRRKVLVLVNPGLEPPPGECSWDYDKIAAQAAILRAQGIQVVAVNADAPPSIAASSEILGGVTVAPRGQGVGRPAVRRALTRSWPDSLIKSGTLTDTLPANIDYVPGSANPPAVWDPAGRTLTWMLSDLALRDQHRFILRIKPAAEGLWPTNVAAVAEVVDGWGNPARVLLPIPKIRVFGERPPSATPSPTRTRTPTITSTPGPSATPSPTKVPRPIYLPALLHTEPCKPDSRHADIVLVIDTSGSMSETTSAGGLTKLAAAQDAARTFLGRLVTGRDQAALIQFNTAATVLVPLTGDIVAVTAGLSTLSQASGTRIDLALDAAAAELVGPNRRADNVPVIILLTDGEPSGVSPEAVREAAARAKAEGALVFTIGLGKDLDARLLTDLASRPDWYLPAPDTRDLAAIYARIVVEIPCKPMWP